MKQRLIEKYDVQAPRYTSYPPVPYWEKAPTSELWFEHIRQTFAQKGRRVDLYIHIPFCRQICHYCGCNRIESSDQGLMRQYVEALKKEWDLYKNELGNFELASLHLGGGTPTWLSVDLLSSLLGHLFEGKISGSVEVDPRVTTKDHLQLLFEKGISRLSMGIQDFHPDVQKKIGRLQEVSVVEKLLNEARQIGFDEINFDLIFGLPSQTKETLAWTFKQVERLRPETIAFYSFAYVPHFAQNQKMIEITEIPQGSVKRELYEFGREQLFQNAYHEIGMDHFALAHSSLSRALKEKNLTRSFMGYTVRKAPILLALGTSSIASSRLSFIQNEKDINKYIQTVHSGNLPIIKGHVQTEKDLEVERIIQEIMCLGESDIGNVHPEALNDFIHDELIEIKGNILTVTELGRAFLRNIAHVFDHRFSLHSTKGFSRTV